MSHVTIIQVYTTWIAK